MLDIFDSLTDVLKEAAMITSFVMVMMLLIEYINVQTRGNWAKHLQKSGWLQIVIASLLGILPGCLGTFTVISLYAHNLLRFSALIAATIATFGDEAFVVFTMIPETAFKLMFTIFLIALAAGFIILLFEKKISFIKTPKNDLHVHQQEDNCKSFDIKNILPQFKNISFPRAVLLLGILLYIFNLAIGTFEHNHVSIHDHADDWNWIKISFTSIAIIALFVVSTVSDHFLEKHLWEHIIKVHLLKTFLWIVGVLLFIHTIENYLDISVWIESNYFTILILAVLIGIIPESGPHIVFITLFIQGTIPFGILLANSIVQDGHGALPLLAESKRSFILVKLINLIIGFIVGLISLYVKL